MTVQSESRAPKKISLKKNWGKCSKGFSSALIPLANFESGSILDDYRIASYLIRGNQIFVYGEDSAIKSYSYIYEKLSQWLKDNIYEYLKEAGFPKNLMISIGATRYTDFGEHNFLQNDDKACVILYPQSKFSAGEIEAELAKVVFENGTFSDGISALIQTVVLPS